MNFTVNEETLKTVEDREYYKPFGMEILEPGQTWYIKHKGAAACITVVLEEVTKATVVLRDTEDRYKKESRYAIRDIEWVEKIYA